MGFEGPVGIVKLREEVWVGVMVKDVVDASVRFGSEMLVHELKQQVPARG